MTIMAIPPAAARAAEPRAPVAPKTSAAKKDVAVRSATPSPQNSSLRPGVRTPASFTPQMPLSEAIDILRNCTTPPLNIVVLWRSLDGAGIYQDTPIGIDGLPRLRVGQYLDALTLSLSAGAADKVGYVVGGGVITIGTVSALPAARPITRVYDISDLTAPPANYRFSPIGYGMGIPSMPGNTYGAGIPGLGSSSSGSTRARTNSAPRGR
jgi:hypothetical protein